MSYLPLIITIISSYLVGAIPFGWLIAKTVSGIDIRFEGSGNIGATNVTRHIGKGWGFLTMILDTSKGFFIVLIAGEFLSFNLYEIAMVGLSAVIGHQYSIYQRFSGGKGVSTAFGVFLYICPIAAFLSLICFIIGVYCSGYISAGSILASIFLPVFIIISNSKSPLLLLSIIISTLILIKHNSNIIRLIRREELTWKNRADHLNISSSRSSSSSE